MCEVVGSAPSVVIENFYTKIQGVWNDPNVRYAMLNCDLTDIIHSISLPNISSLTIHNSRGDNTLNINSNNF